MGPRAVLDTVVKRKIPSPGNMDHSSLPQHEDGMWLSLVFLTRVSLGSILGHIFS
jgi:hypothetical protein